MNRTDLWSEDELDTAMAALHAGVRTDDDELERVRTALLAAATLGVLRPVPGPGETTHGPSTAGARSTRGRPRHRRWIAVAATIAALVAGGVVLETTSIGGNRPSSALAAELNAAADRVVAVDRPVRPGQYRLIRTYTWEGGSTTTDDGRNLAWKEEHLYQTWVPADWTKTWMQRIVYTGRRTWVSGTDADAKKLGLSYIPRGVDVTRARCGGFGTDAATACRRTGHWSDPTPAWLAGLPRDPWKLYQRLRADSARNQWGDAQLFMTASDALRTGLLPADLRAALYRALAYIPGLKITDRAANLEGRVGVAYGMDLDAVRKEVVIDPRTGQFIGERTVGLPGNDRLKPGQAVPDTAVSTTVVNRIGATR